MASKRFIKKCVNNLTNDLLTECVVYSHFHKDKADDKSSIVMQEILKLHGTIITTINNPANKDDYKKNKENFKSVVADMNKMVAQMDGLE